MSDRTSLAGIDRLLIDGNNFLHRVSGGVDEGAQRLLLARLRALPEQLTTILMLDGHPASGTDRRQRVTRQLEIHHAGSLSADDALLNLVRDQAAQSRHATVIVTDDRALTDRARHLGARTQRLHWLEQLLAGSASRAGVGIGAPNRSSAKTEPEAERTPWTPGRGATRKRGNPRRAGR